VVAWVAPYTHAAARPWHEGGMLWAK
jgi:hypothetical protein